MIRELRLHIPHIKQTFLNWLHWPIRKSKRSTSVVHGYCIFASVLSVSAGVIIAGLILGLNIFAHALSCLSMHS